MIQVKKLAQAAAPERLARYIDDLAQTHEHNHGSDGSVETVREDDHDAHHIVIRTTYKIQVDGKVLRVPLALANDGQLHCHSLPNYQFASAIDMVKRLIDTFPDDFRRKRSSKKRSARHRRHESRKSGKSGGR